MTVILAVVALICFVISLFDARAPWVAIGGICLSLAVLIVGGDLSIDTD